MSCVQVLEAVLKRDSPISSKLEGRIRSALVLDTILILISIIIVLLIPAILFLLLPTIIIIIIFLITVLLFLLLPISPGS